MSVWVVVPTVVFLGAMHCWTNRMNALFFFGRTVSVEVRQSAMARAITRTYRWSIAVATLGCSSLVLLLHMRAFQVRHHPLYGLAILLEAFLCFRIFGEANGRARLLQQVPTATTERNDTIEVDLAATPRYWVPGLLASAAPLAVASLGYATASWCSTGATPALRHSALMAGVNRHGMATLLGMAIGMLFSGTILLLLMRSTTRLRTRMAQYVVRSCFVLAWSAAGMVLLLFAANSRNAVLSHGWSNVIQGTIFCLVIGRTLWNQWRARAFVPAPVEQGADDRWRWGLFYVDRNDPALFVQSRCGAGYGLNYGKRIAWPIVFAVCAYMVAVFLILPMRH